MDTKSQPESSPLASPGVYRIPQRSPDYIPTSHSPLAGPPTLSMSDKKSRVPPKPLSLSPASQRFVGPMTSVSPTTRYGPMTAPAASQGSSRWSSTAAERGLSIAPALAKQRHSTATASSAQSIWSANLQSIGAASGWISPALASARSVGSAARTRGLTVAVLNSGNEVLLEALPTPGLGRTFSTPDTKPDSIMEEKEEEMEMLREEVTRRASDTSTVPPALSTATIEAKRPRESKSISELPLISSHSL